MVARALAHQLQTFWLENFGGGLDLRAGEFSLDQNRFADLCNIRVTKGRFLERRPPVVRVAGTYGNGVLGSVTVNGALYSFAPKASAGASVPTGVSLLLYDAPAGDVFGQTTLLDVDMVNGSVQVLLQHALATGQFVTLLHVFDQAADQLTYVTDPRFPWSHQLTAFGRIPITSLVSKAWIATPTFDVASSATALPRIWNQLEQADVVSQGYEYHFFAAAPGIHFFQVPQRYEDVIDLARFPFYVIELFTGTNGKWEDPKSWTAVTEDAIGSAPAVGHAAIYNTPNVSGQASYANWVQLTINAATAATWYRIRIFPPNTAPLPVFTYVQSGCLVKDPYNRGEIPPASFIGNGLTKVFTAPIGLYWYNGFPATYTVSVAGATKTLTTDYALTAGPNGEVVCTFVVAPALGAEVLVDPFGTTGTTTDYLNNLTHVPAGSIMTPQGLKQFAGGVVTSTYDQPCMIGIQMDANYNPVGLISVVAGSAGSSGAFTSGIPGATRLSACWIGSRYAPNLSIVPYAWMQGYDLTSRDPTWDQTEFLRAGLYAGAGDAGFIATGQQQNGGGPVTMLTGARNRLLISYRSSSELWKVDQNPVNNGLLDVSPIGTGAQTQAYAVPFQSSVIIPSENGIRSIDIQRAIGDNLVDRQIGDEIDAYGSPNQFAAAYWVSQGSYVSAVAMPGGLQFLAMDYSAQSKIKAWQRWTVAGIASVDYKTMISIDNRLYFRSGAYLYYFDAAATVYADFADPVGAAYESLAMWHFNHFKRPMVEKRFSRLHALMVGTASFTFRSLVWDDGYEELGPTFTGSTVGQVGMPLMMKTSSLAPVVRSRDVTGWRLEAVGLTLQYLKQGIL